MKSTEAIELLQTAKAVQEATKKETLQSVLTVLESCDSLDAAKEQVEALLNA